MTKIGKQAWFALMNRKSRTALRRSPVQTRPRLLTRYRAPGADAGSPVAAGTTRHAQRNSGQAGHPPSVFCLSARAIQLRMDCAVGPDSRGRSSGSRPARAKSTIWRRNSGEWGSQVFGMMTPFAKAFGVSIDPGQSQYQVGDLKVRGRSGRKAGHTTALNTTPDPLKKLMLCEGLSISPKPAQPLPGTHTRNCEPWPISLSMLNCPRCRVRICFTMASPSPVLPSPRPRPLSTR